MFRAQTFVAAGFAMLLVMSAGCGRTTKPDDVGAGSPPLPAEHRFALKVDGKVVQARLAVSDAERSRGLMAVTSMPENEGMLFVWTRPQRMSFYMRNTRIPLDIGYFDETGVLREVYQMLPGFEDNVTSMASNLRYALEMNEGWYERNGVRRGAVLDKTDLRAALRARGFDPANYMSDP